jgi:transposase
MIFVMLSAEERDDLERVSRQGVGRVALRAQMILLSGRGYSVPAIAAIHDCGQDVVRIWLHRYDAHGIAGLNDEPKSGRPPKDPLARHILDAQASQSPECSGYVQSCWTVALLTAFVAVRFHLLLSCSSVRRSLKQMTWRWARPRLAPASLLRRKRDPATAAKRAAIADALTRVAAGAARLLYLDECDLQLLPVLRKMWMKGPRVRVPTPGQNARHAFFGALDAASGVFHVVDHQRKLASDFVTFLDRLATIYSTGPLYLVLDGAPTHTAKVVRTWLVAHPRVQLFWLPKYSGHEDNPTERIWGLMKDTIAANRLAGRIDTLVIAANRFFNELSPHPVTLPEAA